VEQVILNKGIGIILIALAENQEALNDTREIDGCLVMKIGGTLAWPDNEFDVAGLAFEALHEAMEFEGFSTGNFDGGDKGYYLIDARVVFYNPQGEILRFLEFVGETGRQIFGVTDDLRSIRWF
jgi:hypothetical protein